MAILALWNLKNRCALMSENPLICPVRGRPVALLPEELVRVRLLHFLLDAGYPKHCVAIEKELKHMPHQMQACTPLPQRRADIVCFAKDIHAQEPLYPLLLIECKGVPLTLSMRKQVTGYNYFLGAYFVALVNQTESWLGWQDLCSGSYQWIKHFPTYLELISRLQALHPKLRLIG